jgi:predicted chitinase
MADVTGDLGGQPIQLNNAATEATLKQLVAAVTLMAARSGKDVKSQKQLESELNKFVKQLDKAEKALETTEKTTDNLSATQKKAAQDQVKREKALEQSYDRAIKNQEAVVKKYQEQGAELAKAKSAVTGLANGINTLGNSLFSLASSFANAGNNLEAGGAAFETLPIFGGMIANAFRAVVGAAEKMYKNFNEMGGVGANFGGSMSRMMGTLSGTGLSLESFTAIVGKNAESLRLLGNNTAEGAQRFARLSKNLKDVGGDALSRLGYSTEQMNEGMAVHMQQLASTGQLQKMNDAQIAASTKDYLIQLDGVAKFTGKNKEALMAEQKARQEDAQFRFLQARMDAKSGERLENTMKLFGPASQKAIQGILATGTASNDQAKTLAITSPRTFQALQQLSAKIRAGGTATQAELDNVQSLYQQEGKAIKNNATAISLGTFQTEKHGQMLVEQMKMGEKQGTAAEARTQAEKDAAKVQEQQAAQIKNAKDRMAELSNKFLEILGSGQMFGAMMNALEKLLKVLVPIMEKAFIFIANNITTIGYALAGLGVAIGVLTALIMANAAKQAAAGLGLDKLIKGRDALKDPLKGAGDFVGPPKPKTLPSPAAGKAGMLSKAMGPLSGMFEKMGGMVGRLMGPLSGMFSSFSSLGGMLLRFAGPIGLVIGSFQLVSGVLEEFGYDFGDVADWLGEKITEVGNYISGLYDEYLKPVFTFIGDLFKKAIQGIVYSITHFRLGLLHTQDKLIKVGEFLQDKVMDPFGDLIHWLGDNFGSMLDKILNTLGPTFGGISDEELARRNQIRDLAKEERKQQRDSRTNQRKLDEENRKTRMRDEEDAIKKSEAEREARKEAKARAKEDKNAAAATSAKTQAEADAKKAAEAAAKPDAYDDPNKLARQFAEQQAGKRPTMGGGTTTPSTVPAAPPGSAPSGMPPPGPPPSQAVQQNMAMVEDALKKQGITDPKYIAAVKANIMKETGGKSISENMNYGGTSNQRIRDIFGSRAAGKSDAELDSIKKDPSKMGEMMYGSGTKLGQQMGNTEPGDGFKYRGRGFIQLTGKNNYAAASKAIYGDDRLVKNPDLVNDPNVASQVSAWYMKKGQSSMAGKLGINTSNMSQADANLLATSQIAGGDIRNKGKIGAEILGKVNAYSGQFGGGSTAAPSTAAAQQTVTPAPAPTTSPQGTSQPAPSSKPMNSGKAQESAESLLAQLNSKMDQLLAVNARLADSNDKQLRVQRSISQGSLVA